MVTPKVKTIFRQKVSVYDIERAVKDGATVPIYYESRLARLELDEAERPKLDEEFEEATEGEEAEHKERLKTKWAQLEALVGAEKRVRLIAQDLVHHFERRLEVMDGKVADDSFKMVIVRDMWLIGFDVPCLHTMYMDKPMRGHGLMQAIARVNRVFKDKPGGLVVDYLGLAHELKSVLATYTESGGKGRTAVDQEEAVAVMLEKYEVCCGIFRGFDWSAWIAGGSKERLAILPAAQEHVLQQEDGKNRLARVEFTKLAFLVVVSSWQTLNWHRPATQRERSQLRFARSYPPMVPPARQKVSTDGCYRSLLLRSETTDAGKPSSLASVVVSVVQSGRT